VGGYAGAVGGFAPAAASRLGTAPPVAGEYQRYGETRNVMSSRHSALPSRAVAPGRPQRVGQPA
jgi:hypothetical protein